MPARVCRFESCRRHQRIVFITRSRQISTFDDAIAYLHRQVPRGRTLRFPGQRGVDRARALLTALGNPQEQLRVVHVAGTSGKGSTATLIAALLEAHGFRVGLHLSPYLLDIRERIQLNRHLISKREFATVVNDVARAAESVSATKLGQPTYFELLVAAAFLMFHRARVDYAVVETGMGGLYDGTNVVDRADKLCVLTPIDVDHAPILGSTPRKNAAQKAGIIQRGNTVVSTVQSAVVRSVIERRIAEVGARLVFASLPKNVTVSWSGTSFDLDGRRGLHLALIGRHQAGNAAVALTVLDTLSRRDHFSVPEQSLRKTLADVSFPGRFDIRQVGHRTVIFDGAHNPQKMRSLIATLQAIEPGQRFDCLAAFRAGKDVVAMLSILEPVARSFIGTTFGAVQDSVIQSVSPRQLREQFRSVAVPTQVISDPGRALAQLVKTVGPPIIVTGSLYLIGVLLPGTREGSTSSNKNVPHLRDRASEVHG